MRKIDPVKQQAKRQQIVDAAIICFAKRGFHATSTAEICAEAGMSPGNLFHYFPSKDAIIQAIAELDRQETTKALAQLDEAWNVVEGLQTLAGQLLLTATDPAYSAISIEIAAEAMRNPAVANLFAATDHTTRTQLVALLERGIERDHVDPNLDVAQTAAWLIALLEGGIGRAVLDPDFDLANSQASLCAMIARWLEPSA
jgi:TetR/AcrR family transcriptional regulator, repressor for uid operon